MRTNTNKITQDLVPKEKYNPEWSFISFSQQQVFKILLICIVFFGVGLSEIFAGTVVFNVISTKGSSQVKRQDGKSWENIKSGDKLFEEDQVKLDDNAYLGLLHSTGTPLEINKSGNYTVKKLVSQATAPKSNVTKKFTKYLVDELKSSDDVLNSGDYRKKMKTLGAVERAIEINNNTLNVSFPFNTYNISNHVNFSWLPIDKQDAYHFSIHNADGQEVFSKHVKGTNLEVDLTPLKLESDECYFWSIESGNYKSQDYCLYNYNNNEKLEITQDLAAIEQEFGTNSPAISSIVKANYLAEKNLNSDANKEFLKAVKETENPNFKVLYAKFLVKLGLEKQAEELIK